MAKNELKDIDKGWRDIQKKLLELKMGKAVSVGVQGDESEEEHGGATNILIGSVHEFGREDGSIKARSHWRSTFDENIHKYQGILDRVAKRVYGPGEGTIGGDLLLLGEKYKTDVIKKIHSSIPPDLADSTVAKHKGETIPLIDTGQYINSFTAVVVSDPNEKRTG